MDISKLNNKDLVEKFSTLVRQEKEAIAKVVLHLAEIDRRKLYLEEAYASLFEYCVKKYHYSENAAFRRIQAARLSHKFPEVIQLLESGKVTLTTLNLLSPHLTPENKQELLSCLFYKSKREAEKILASQFPSAESLHDKIRQLPTRHSVEFTFAGEGSKSFFPSAPISIGLPTGPIEIGLEGEVLSSRVQEAQPKRLEIIKPVTARRYKIELSASEELARKIQRAKEVLRHKYPEGKLEDILGEALELLLQKNDPLRKAQSIKTGPEASSITAKQRVQTRYIPKQVKWIVYKRDQGQCSYVSAEGRRCGEKGGVEVDHIKPYGLGGGHEVENLRLLCRNHNQWRAQKTFGNFR